MNLLKLSYATHHELYSYNSYSDQQILLIRFTHRTLSNSRFGKALMVTLQVQTKYSKQHKSTHSLTKSSIGALVE